MSLIETIAPSLLRNIPELIGWGIGIVLGVIMVRRGGARAEKLFLAGCSLMFAVDLINPFIRELIRWWALEQDMSNLLTAQSMGFASLPMVILSLAGLVCLVWAFWTRFWTKRQGAA